jgi:hypothetical protein
LSGLGDFVKSFLTILVLFALYCLGADRLASAQGANEPLPCDYKKVGLDASKFYIYLTKDTPYTRWPVWPGKDKLSPGKKSHGAYVTTYVNPAAVRSIESRAGMAFGSIIVAEEFDSDKRNTGLAVMIKIKGYNPSAGDWHWFRYASDGSVLAAGRVESCMICHRAQNGNDYLMTAPVR